MVTVSVNVTRLGIVPSFEPLYLLYVKSLTNFAGRFIVKYKFHEVYLSVPVSR